MQKRPSLETPGVLSELINGVGALGRLEISGRRFAALRHDFVADLLAFHEAAHAGLFDRADMYEYILRAVARLDESEAFLGIEKFYSSDWHGGLLAFPVK
jgi:hypothetical protein